MCNQGAKSKQTYRHRGNNNNPLPSIHCRSSPSQRSVAVGNIAAPHHTHIYRIILEFTCGDPPSVHIFYKAFHRENAVFRKSFPLYVCIKRTTSCGLCKPIPLESMNFEWADGSTPFLPNQPPSPKERWEETKNVWIKWSTNRVGIIDSRIEDESNGKWCINIGNRDRWWVQK